MKKLILLSFVSIITLSCGMPSKSDLNFSNSGSQQSLDPDMVVNYSVIKSEVLAPKCLSCHSNVATENGLKAWVTPGKPDSSAFFTLSENGSMPKNGTPLSTRELELFKIMLNRQNSGKKNIIGMNPIKFHNQCFHFNTLKVCVLSVTKV